jgi:hypothetical protein
MSKYTLHVPTVSFGFIETEVDTAEEAIAEHNNLLKLYSGGEGLSDKDFNHFLDKYLTNGTGETEVYMAMNLEQQKVIQTLKRAMKRIEAKNQ